jgi:hypothetical protein
MPGQEERMQRMAGELDKHRVTTRQVSEAFEEVATRGEPGIYPGAGPRRLFDLEMRALREHPELGVMWMAASGHNFSVPREDFLAEGGFDARLTINEHRELALRLQQRGLRMTAVPARSYHMTHRVGWRDPIAENDWEPIFYERHPTPATKLMAIFWQSIADDKHIPREARIESLERLDEVLKEGDLERFDAVRRSHPLLRQLPS